MLGALALVPGGCGAEGGDAPRAGVAEPAGRVLELHGAVTAAREGVPARALGPGDSIYRDDTVTTAPDASVTILLAHNQARWNLAGGKERRVDGSAAWRAERSSGSGSAFDDDEALPTSSAGRHSEPQVGDTRATAPEPAAPPAADQTRVAEQREPPRPAPAERPGRRRESAAAAPAERAKGAVEAHEAPSLALGAAPAPPPAGGAASGPASESEAKRSTSPPATGAAGPAAAPAPSAIRAVLGRVRVTGARAREPLPARSAASFERAAQICAARASQPGQVVLTFAIGRTGSTSDVHVAGPPTLVAEVGACLQGAVTALSFPPRKEGTTRVRQEIRFEIP